jgi:hypothetical protein
MTADPIVGGLYAMVGADGKHRVCKVLAVDDFAVHLRQYSNRYDAAPKAIPPDLTLNGTSIATVGIGHMPIDKQGFAAEPHDLLGVESVDEAELDGYREWLGITAPNAEERMTRPIKVDISEAMAKWHAEND